MQGNRAKGIFFIILAAVGFAIMNTLVKLSGDLPSYEKSFFRNFVALLIAAATILRTHQDFKIQRGAGPFLFWRALLGTLSILCNYYAVDHLLLADASLLNKTSPFFAIIASMFLMKEKIRPGHLAILAMVTFGCVLVLHPSFQNVNLFAGLIGLAGGALAGTAYGVVRKLSALKERNIMIVLCFSGFSCLVTLPMLIIGYKPMTLRQLLLLLGAGCAAALGQFSITTAYSYAPAREISVFSYMQIIFSAVIGFLVFDQLPDLQSWIGYTLIICMGAVMTVYNKYLEGARERVPGTKISEK